MKTSYSRFLMLTAALSLGLITQKLMGQDQAGGFDTPEVNGETRVMPYILPPGNPGGETPRLGFFGTMVDGYGMRVNSVLPGSPASKVGLEGGDVLWRIDGKRILCLHDYRQALQHAVQHHGGWVSLKVRNVRYDWGTSPQEFVTVSVRVEQPQIMAYQMAGSADPDSAEAAAWNGGQSWQGQVHGQAAGEHASEVEAQGEGF